MGDFLRFLANFCHLLCCCILLLSYVYGARELADDHQHAVEVKSLVPASPCSPSTKGLQIAHRYGPCSPLGQGNPPPTAREILLRDRSRVRSLSSISSFPDDIGLETKVPLQKKQIGDGNYVVTIGFGTPKRDLTLMFDTGSALTWIQCKPCTSCYEQDEPIYDPSESLTFSNASCSSTCQHTESYHDKSSISGYFVRDTLTVSTNVFPDFVFLCGQSHTGDFGQVAGVLGTGLADYSLINQTFTKFWQTFCYCLPSTETSNGFLLFGIEALFYRPQVIIPLLSNPDGSNRYFVSLVGITIGQKRLQVSSNGDSLSENAIIDSGTIISRLPATLYSELRSSFQELMSGYPVASPVNPMDTCYNLEGYDISNVVPSMIIHFSNSVDVNLDQSSVVWKENDSQSQVCLAFAEDTETIIANHQQRNKLIYYSILDNEVGFSDGGC